MVMQYIGVPFDMIPILLIVVLHRKNLQAVEVLNETVDQSVASFISKS